MAKGSTFEREICKTLSLWWSQNKRDDCFWRTSGSGARATKRAKTNKKTSGHYADVCAVDRFGEPLIDAFAIEIKRGYSRHSVADLFDVPATAATQEYEKFLTQAIKSHQQSGSVTWMLICRRDRRLPIVIIPSWVATILMGRNLQGKCVFGFSANIQRSKKHDGIFVDAVGMLLTSFLEKVTPVMVRDLAK